MPISRLEFELILKETGEIVDKEAILNLLNTTGDIWALVLKAIILSQEGNLSSKYLLDCALEAEKRGSFILNSNGREIYQQLYNGAKIQYPLKKRWEKPWIKQIF